MRKFSYFVVIILVFLFNMDVYAINKENVEFSSCVDGDTARLILDKKEIKVRFLAIDTPESVHPTKGVEPYGKEASEYTCNALKNAKRITIEYDPDSDKTDKYDRHLVWIYVDDLLLQKELIKKGYAEVDYLYGDYLYTNELKEEQEKAKNNKIGIWSDSEESSTTDDLEDTVNTESEVKYQGLIDKICELLEKICEMLVDFLIDMI